MRASRARYGVVGLCGGEMKTKGKTTLFTAKDGNFVVMKVGETLYRGSNLRMATRAFDTGKPAIPSAEELRIRTIERIIEDQRKRRAYE